MLKIYIPSEFTLSNGTRNYLPVFYGVRNQARCLRKYNAYLDQNYWSLLLLIQGWSWHRGDVLLKTKSRRQGLESLKELKRGKLVLNSQLYDLCFRDGRIWRVALFARPPPPIPRPLRRFFLNFLRWRLLLYESGQCCLE